MHQSRRELYYEALTLRAWFARHRETLTSIAVAGFFLALLGLAVLGQATITNPAVPATAAAPATRPVPTPVATTAPSPAAVAAPAASAPAAPAPAAPAPAAKPAPVAPVAASHTVVAGETLSAIAIRHQLPFEQIAGDSALSDPDQLTVGQRLVLRGPPTGVVMIKAGSTLTGYARTHGQTVPGLLALNPHITNPDKIKAGGWLRVQP